MSTRSEVLRTMIRAAVAAGESLQRDLARRDLLEVHEKGASDFVSSADLRAQEIVREALSAAYPDHGFLLEEGGGSAGSTGRRFIVDPLDGTTNFLHAIPHFAVSIALEVDGEVTHGVVVDPMKREVFSASKGEGAWLGDQPLRVSSERDLTRAIVGTGIPHRGRGRHDTYLEALAGVMGEVAGIRRMGAATLDLAYVAAGRVEAFFEQGLAAWDVAAGSLLVREAGGVVTQTDGVIVPLSGDVLAASSEEVHAAIRAKLAPLHRASAERG